MFKKLCKKEKSDNNNIKVEMIQCRNLLLAHALLSHLANHCEHDRNIDFFTMDDLTSKIDKNSFKANLSLSDWSNNFVHGADMMPSMIEGLNKVLKDQLGYIKKIKFKEKTTGDIHYTIISKKSQTLEEGSIVSGSCIDKKGELYYFYGEEERWSEFPHKYINNLPLKLLGKELLMREKHINSNNIPLLGYQGEESIQYTEKMKENNGFIRATVMDLINIVYQKEIQKPGLIMGYENLELSENFAVEKFMNGHYSLSTTIIGNPHKTIKGTGYKVQFMLKDNTDGITLSGGTTLRTPIDNN